MKIMNKIINAKYGQMGEQTVSVKGRAR